MEKDYGQVLSLVIEELNGDELLWNLAIAFSESKFFDEAAEIVAEQYYQAMLSDNDFEMSLKDYLFSRLDEEGVNMKLAMYFQSEQQAEREGFYWFDELNRWVKLDFEVKRVY